MYLLYIYTFYFLPGVLNTSKNSTAILEKWKSLPRDIISEIEHQCKNVMDFMGYKPYKPET